MMRKEYLEELQNLKERMEKAEAFALKIPALADIIIERKITGEEPWLEYTRNYKKLYMGWGLTRGFYDSRTTRYVLNYPKDKPHSEYLFSVYINCYSLFDEQRENFNLYDYVNDLDLFFIDHANSTFYATDEQITPLLDSLNAWIIQAFDRLNETKRLAKIEKLKAELAATEGATK